MQEVHKIPRRGKAGVAFAGAEFGDALPLVASIFIALFAGNIFGMWAYVTIPALGYVVTKIHVSWKANTLPGHVATAFYTWGISGFSRAFDTKKKVYLGSSTIVNPGAARLIDEAAHKAGYKVTK